MSDDLAARYYLDFACAFIRGRLPDAFLAEIHLEIGGAKPCWRKRRHGAGGSRDEVAAGQCVHVNLLLCKKNPRPNTAKGQTK